MILNGLRWMLVFLLLTSTCTRRVVAADMLKWDPSTERVDAEVESWTIPQVLQRVSAVSGWRIFVDPKITDRVTTKFQNKEYGDALQRLLGNISYALVPDTNGSPRLYVFRTSQRDATHAISTVELSRREKALIDNELVVTLKPGESIEELAKKLGARVIGKSEGQNAYRLRFDDAEATADARTQLGEDPAVEEVDNNYYVSRPESPELLGGAGAPLALRPKAVPNGDYVIVGLIDSAVQSSGVNIADFLLPGLSVTGETKAPDDRPTHGTSMAETILRGRSFSGLEQDTIVRIQPVNVYAMPGGNESVSTSTFDVAAGVFKAAENGAAIINLSLGSDGDSAFLRETIRSASEQGVVFLAAAGNQPVTTPTYPAAYPWVIAVTATDRQGNIAPYANRGDFIDTAAPGTSLVSFGGTQFYITGTSASTAYASGLAAAVAEQARRQNYTGSLDTLVRDALANRRPVR